MLLLWLELNTVLFEVLPVLFVRVLFTAPGMNLPDAGCSPFLWNVEGLVTPFKSLVGLGLNTNPFEDLKELRLVAEFIFAPLLCWFNIELVVYLLGLKNCIPVVEELLLGNLFKPEVYCWF